MRESLQSLFSDDLMFLVGSRSFLFGFGHTYFKNLILTNVGLALIQFNFQQQLSVSFCKFVYTVLVLNF